MRPFGQNMQLIGNMVTGKRLSHFEAVFHGNRLIARRMPEKGWRGLIVYILIKAKPMVILCSGSTTADIFD